MIKAIIVDDEQVQRNALKSLLKDLQDKLTVCAEAATVEEAVACINTHQPDLVFLDIRLKKGTGFDILRQVDRTGLDVIFTTAYSQYAIDAIKYAALDYLLKPIDPKELKEAVDRVAVRENKSLEARLAVLEEILLNAQRGPAQLVLSDASGFKVVKLDEVIRCEGEKNYTTFHLINDRKIIVTSSLITYERMLEKTSFFRVYKSHLINLRHMIHYKKSNGGQVTMKDGAVIPVSREKKHMLMKKISEIL